MNNHPKLRLDRVSIRVIVEVFLIKMQLQLHYSYSTSKGDCRDKKV